MKIVNAVFEAKYLWFIPFALWARATNSTLLLMIALLVAFCCVIWGAWIFAENARPDFSQFDQGGAGEQGNQ